MKLRIVPYIGETGTKYWYLEAKSLFWWTRISDYVTNKDILVDLAKHIRTPPENI